MKDYIKKALDDLVKNRPQINLDSEAARIQIAEHVAHCIKESLIAISKSKYSKDIVSVSAGNYGGKLGQHHFHLRKILK